MKFTQETFTAGKEILLVKDHYVSISGMLDAADGVADSNGKKIIPKGTFVGGESASFLADRSQNLRVIHCVASLRTLLMGADNDIVLTALGPEGFGDDISLTLVDPADTDKDLAVTVTGKSISVALKTGSTGAIATTAAELVAAINTHATAKTLVVASLPDTATGAGVVTALAKTPLAFVASGASVVDGILLEDVDVTYGDKICPVLIHGFVKTSALPYPPAAAVSALFSPSLQLSFVEC